MARKWIHENPAYWDRGKDAVIGAAPEGSFPLGAYREGEMIPDEWWRVEEDGLVVGYGRMDHTWGDAEILLAVDPAHQEKGIGTFILEHLEQEARARGLNYLYNAVPEGHPDADRLTRWLERRGFQRSHEDWFLRRKV